MAATRLQKNWTAVSVAGVDIVHVNSCNFGLQGQLLPYMGDNSILPTVVAVHSMQPHCTIVSGDVYTLINSCPTGTSGTITATSPDALGAVGGNVVYTFTDAVVQNVDIQGAWGAYATCTLTAIGSSSDGVTNPLSISLA